MFISITGAQFGDEGKGKITDFTATPKDLVVRWSGGSNAGHTIQFENKQYKLRLVPSGVFKGSDLLISGNTIVDPIKLQEELIYLEINDFVPKLYVDEECIISLPIHKKIDARNDLILKIGTTKSGIGPTVSDFAARIAIKIKDVLSGDYKEKLNNLLRIHTDYLEEEFEENLQALQLLKTIPVTYVTRECAREDFIYASRYTNVIFEGAQGTMLDINHGTYPYCTSTPCVSSAIPYVMGMGYDFPEISIGVFKPYVTRVGNGDFRTEITEGSVKEHLQLYGKEIGTNTGRTRRVGWLDLYDLKKAKDLNDFNSLAITKLDVLSGLESIGVLDTKKNWWNFNGWKNDISDCKNYNHLPSSAKELIDFISKSIQVPIETISLGADRTQTIERYT
jgi:adenylosuccinate synthase